MPIICTSYGVWLFQSCNNPVNSSTKFKNKDISTPLTRILRSRRPKALSHTYHIKNSSFNNYYAKFTVAKIIKDQSHDFPRLVKSFSPRQASQLVTPRESNNKRARTAHGQMYFAAGQDCQYLKLTKTNHSCYTSPEADVTSCHQTGHHG